MLFYACIQNNIKHLILVALYLLTTVQINKCTRLPHIPLKTTNNDGPNSAYYIIRTGTGRNLIIIKQFLSNHIRIKRHGTVTSFSLHLDFFFYKDVACLWKKTMPNCQSSQKYKFKVKQLRIDSGVIRCQGRDSITCRPVVPAMCLLPRSWRIDESVVRPVYK